MRKICLLIVLLALLGPVDDIAAENSVKIGAVVQNGVTIGGGKLVAGLPVEFTLRLTVGDGPVAGSTNGFAVYAFRNGAYTDNFDRATGWWNNTYPMAGFFDGINRFAGGFGLDGAGRDTVKFGGYTGGSNYIPVGSWDLFFISTGGLVAGDTLGIDSSWYPPGGAWLWSKDYGDVYPDWPGPYNFPVVNCCAYAGDCNFSGNITVTDLTALVRYVFPPHTPLLCADAGNADGRSSGGVPVNVADVTYLVAHLFRGGPPPVTCE